VSAPLFPPYDDPCRGLFTRSPITKAASQFYWFKKEIPAKYSACKRAIVCLPPPHCPKQLYGLLFGRIRFNWGADRP